MNISPDFSLIFNTIDIDNKVKDAKLLDQNTVTGQYTVDGKTYEVTVEFESKITRSNENDARKKLKTEIQKAVALATACGLEPTKKADAAQPPRPSAPGNTPPPSELIISKNWEEVTVVNYENSAKTSKSQTLETFYESFKTRVNVQGNPFSSKSTQIFQTLFPNKKFSLPVDLNAPAINNTTVKRIHTEVKTSDKDIFNGKVTKFYENIQNTKKDKKDLIHKYNQCLGEMNKNYDLFIKDPKENTKEYAAFLTIRDNLMEINHLVSKDKIGKACRLMDKMFEDKHFKFNLTDPKFTFYISLSKTFHEKLPEIATVILKEDLCLSTINSKFDPKEDLTYGRDQPEKQTYNQLMNQVPNSYKDTDNSGIPQGGLNFLKFKKSEMLIARNNLKLVSNITTKIGNNQEHQNKSSEKIKNHNEQIVELEKLIAIKERAVESFKSKTLLKDGSPVQIDKDIEKVKALVRSDLNKPNIQDFKDVLKVFRNRDHFQSLTKGERLYLLDYLKKHIEHVIPGNDETSKLWKSYLSDMISLKTRDEAQISKKKSKSVKMADILTQAANFIENPKTSFPAPNWKREYDKQAEAAKSATNPTAKGRS